MDKEIKYGSRLSKGTLKESAISTNESRVGKTKVIKVLQGNYGYGWDDLIEYDVKDFNGNILEMSKEIRNDLRDYEENERNASHRVITRRVPVENLKESASHSNIEFVKSFLNKLVSDNKIRALKDGERLPRGFTFKSSSGTNGEVTYKGTDYTYALVNGKLKVMPSRDAGYNWSETIYKESLNNVLKDDSTIEEAWTTFVFKSGGNPYIAKTEKEKQRILNKYKGKVKETKKGFYEIDDRKSDNFLPEAVTNLNAKKYTAQEFVDIATSNGVEGADIILDWDGTANKKEYFNVWKSYLLDTYLDLEDDLYNMSEQDTIKRNRETVIYPLMDLREPEVINESLNEELDDGTKLEVKTELINMTRAYPNEHGFNVKTTEIKDFVKKELKSMGYEVEISGDDRVNPMQYHIEYFKKLNESKIIEGAKGFLRTLGRDTVQYFTHKNRFNYTIKQIRIDNKNKTYEFGNFKVPYRLESTQNGKEFERLVDKLKEMGYTEIKKSLKERLTKRK
jgi:hypothetical protein